MLGFIKVVEYSSLCESASFSYTYCSERLQMNNLERETNFFLKERFQDVHLLHRVPL